MQVDADGSCSSSAGCADLVVLKSTGSEFAGFLVDEYTTLPPTHDRVLATSLAVEWTYVAGREARLGRRPTPRSARRCSTGSPNVHCLALQQSLWEMGRAVLEAHPDVASIELSPRTSTTSPSTSARSGSTTPARSST